MNIERQHEQILAEKAAKLLHDVQQGGAKEGTTFVRWVKQSPVHAREMLLATAWDYILGKALDPERRFNIDQLMLKARNNVTPIALGLREIEVQRARDDAPAAVEVAAAAAAPRTEAVARPVRRSRWFAGFAAAATVLLTGLLGWYTLGGKPTTTEQYQTETGEQRTVSLNDGSVVYLNTQSRIRLAFTADARDIHLEGQAIFKVAHDASRPFRVHVENGQVQAIGTQFDVNAREGHTDVAVLEGLVKVTTANATLIKRALGTDLPAGRGLSIGSDGAISEPVEIEPSTVVAWRKRQLVFRNHTLQQIATEFNRYNKVPKIRVEGEVLQAKRYSGVFDADDPESFLDYLALDHQLTFERRGDEFVVIRMRSSYASSPHARAL